MKNTKSLFILFLISVAVFGQSKTNEISREHILFDFDWKFALGHACDKGMDFNNATGYFSYLAKTGYGDGAAAKDFDDRAWRTLNVPHDWCVELPFTGNGSHSHGYKAMGKNFPENSVGWYRKEFQISKDDLGKKISIEFEGIFRNSIVWVNGYYLGTEMSGYTGMEYDITDYLNYGGDNVVAVRVDASMEEGWYYEGAGIYRHVWLNKKNTLHVDRYGTFITTDVLGNEARINTQTSIKNTSAKERSFIIKETITDASKNIISTSEIGNQTIKPGHIMELGNKISIINPQLWDIENPYLHTLITEIFEEGKVVDRYETKFGIRTVRFDKDKGFFLNGKHVKIVGANNHQDHAGVGMAIPNALHEFRIKKMQEMGANGIRTAHEPHSPAFLDACDRLGMLVMAENRLMGSNEFHFSYLEKMMKRDRNHPSVVIWSLGNEEWAIEGNITGARITKTMQDFAMNLDSSRAFTAACSGGWDNGTGMVTQVMGYNYIVQGDIDRHHKLFPWQASIGTEETTTQGTRGIYVTNATKGHLAPPNTDPNKPGCEYGWNFYQQREFLSGIFFWTGFDYRGEPTPFAWPAVTSQFGLMDLCGFPKDIVYYLKSWWTNEPVLHIAYHWNWSGDEGKEKQVTVYSNCEEVELFLNKKSLGKKKMPVNGHLEWTVKYKSGILMAKGYNKGKETLISKIETASEPNEILLSAHKKSIKADGQDVSVVTIQVNDNKERFMPLANNKIEYTIEGPGRIIGIGNGNPSSHDAEQFFEKINVAPIKGLKELSVENLSNRIETAKVFDDNEWEKAFDNKETPWDVYKDTLLVVRGEFTITDLSNKAIINLFSKSILENQSIYVNGKLIASNIVRDDPNQSFTLDKSIISQGKNTIAFTGQRFKKKHNWDEPNTNPGLIQIIEPDVKWTGKAFNGLAQVIVQSEKEAGEITLKATSDSLEQGEIKIISK